MGRMGKIAEDGGTPGQFVATATWMTLKGNAYDDITDGLMVVVKKSMSVGVGNTVS